MHHADRDHGEADRLAVGRAAGDRLMAATEEPPVRPTTLIG
jgi:hypothetical protein